MSWRQDKALSIENAAIDAEIDDMLTDLGLILEGREPIELREWGASWQTSDNEEGRFLVLSLQGHKLNADLVLDLPLRAEISGHTPVPCDFGHAPCAPEWAVAYALNMIQHAAGRMAVPTLTKDRRVWDAINIAAGFLTHGLPQPWPHSVFVTIESDLWSGTSMTDGNVPGAHKARLEAFRLLIEEICRKKARPGLVRRQRLHGKAKHIDYYQPYTHSIPIKPPETMIKMLNSIKLAEMKLQEIGIEKPEDVIQALLG